MARDLAAVADLIRDYISPEGASRYYQNTGITESDFSPILPQKFEGSIFAIDGSNATIFDLAAAKVNYIRTGYVVYRGTSWQRTEIANEIFVADQESYAQTFERNLKDIFGIEETFTLEETELDRLSTYFRELQEYAALFEALDRAQEGDLVLYDGGFAFWKEGPFKAVLDQIFERAENVGADLLGISKSSTFSWNAGLSRPFVQDTARIGSQVIPDRPWMIDLKDKNISPRPESSWKGKIRVVKFHPHAGRAFRVDVPPLIDADRALSHAATRSSSAECLGYPHALFRAHREIRITDQESWLLRRALLDELGSRGVSEEQVRGFLDYHDFMEMRPGRML